MVKRISAFEMICVLLYLAILTGIAADVYAEDHVCRWEEPVVMYEDLSADQHKVITQYQCSVCGNTKEETKEEAHDWRSIEFSDAKCLSSEQHSCTEVLACEKCNYEKKEYRKEKHRLNDFNVCEICAYVKKGAAVTLKSGKAQKVNQKTWCKIKVKKRGYLTVKTKKQTTGISFYNHKKKKYTNLDLCCSSDNSYTEYIPVPKGIYYIRTTDPAELTCTFRKDPSGKNYDLKTAIKLKKNRLYPAIVYSDSKIITRERYYKFVLKKPQKVKFSLRFPLYDPFVIDDADGYVFCDTKSYQGKNGEQIRISERKLPRGTYYVHIGADWNENYGDDKKTTGEYLSIKWIY